MADVKTTFGIISPYAKTDLPGFICGVEYEIESVKKIKAASDFVEVKEDGSLRNNGKEFVTIPDTLENQLMYLNWLKENLVLGEDPFSQRTSVHVHVNVKTLSMKQLNELVLLYALFEPLFFDFVGQDRANSNYCVPLTATYLPNFYKKGITYLVNHWHKYTALNLKPVSTLGTVEFRHMYGTLDENDIKPWLKLLKKLYMFVHNNPDFSIKRELMNGVTTLQLLNKVFNIRTAFDEADFYHTSLDVRLSFVGDK